MSSSRHVHVLQTTLPAYRLDLFEDVSSLVGLTVFFGTQFFEPSLPAAASGSFDSVQVRNRFLFARRLLWQSLPWRRLLLADSYDVIVEASPRILSTVLLVLLRRLLGRRTIMWGHVRSRSGHVGAVRRLLFHVGGRFLAYTDQEAGRALELGLVAGTARNALYRRSEESPVSVPHEQSGSTLNVLWSGRLSRDKRPDLLLDVAAECVARGVPVEFHVVGDGPYRDDLVRRAYVRGLARCFVWHGARWGAAEIGAIASRCHVALSTEYVGLSIIQAHWFGLPLVYPGRASHAPEIDLACEGFDVSWDTDRDRVVGALRRGSRAGAEKRRAVADVTRERHCIESQAQGLLDSVCSVKQPSIPGAAKDVCSFAPPGHRGDRGGHSDPRRSSSGGVEDASAALEGRT